LPTICNGKQINDLRAFLCIILQLGFLPAIQLPYDDKTILGSLHLFSLESVNIFKI
jgi:hypothetical protein